MGGKVIAVVGATGLQGTPVTRRLLGQGWHVRALTRNPTGTRARALADLGAEVVQADAADIGSLERAFAGAYGVYNVQNHHVSGYDGEVTQGRNVADAAAHCGVSHFVYGSAGVGREDTGVGSWDTKVAVTEHVRSLGLPLTVLRPMAFMELMTEKRFYPAASVWHVMPKLMGETRPVGWLSVDDLAVIAGKAFADTDAYVGRDLPLTSDVQSIADCRAVWQEVTGRPPRRFPMPVRLFERFSGTDETTMWRWLRQNDVDLDTGAARAVLPDALTVREWLARRQGR
ncbi:MAG: NmrA/HSCARG family protein [Acidimicrobiia bacterium]